MSKYFINKCHRELLAYSFPVTIYDKLVNGGPKKNESSNDSFNRNVFINTSKDYYLDDDRIIYYNSLRDVNTSIEDWIEIFLIKAKMSNDNKVIYDYYQYILHKIRDEIGFFTKKCMVKYNLKNIIPDTLIWTYISILTSRYINISEDLYTILREEYGIYLSKEKKSVFNEKINNICYKYIKMLLKNENIDDSFYMLFREEIDRLLIECDNSKMLIKRVKEN